jgi:hypothetical protein
LISEGTTQQSGQQGTVETAGFFCHWGWRGYRGSSGHEIWHLELRHVSLGLGFSPAETT